MDSDKPLSAHMRLDYHECYAKIVLESIFHEQFDLVIVDKPDLQDIRKSIGIEVTQGRNPQQQEIESLYSKLPYVQDSVAEKIKKQIEKRGGKLSGGILGGISERDDFSYSVNAFGAKLDKINNGKYRAMERYDLFVFDDCLDMTPDGSVIQNIELIMQKKQSRVAVRFQNVYICTPGILWYLDLKNIKIEKFDIGSRQFDWAIQARKMVEKAEKEVFM